MIHLGGHPRQPILSLAFSPDSMLLTSGAKDGGLRLWDVCGELVKEVTGPTNHARHALAWNPDGSGFAASSALELALVSADGQVIGLHAIGRARLTTLAFLSPALLAVGTSGALHLWDVPQRKLRPLKRIEHEGVRAVAAHPPTKQLAWLSMSKLSLWDITKATPRTVPLRGIATSVALSPDGKLVTTATAWDVRCLEVTRDAERDVMRGHKGQVSGVAFTPDGRRIVSGSWDETVRLWDVTTGRETACFDLKVGKVNAVAVSPDGSRAAAGTLDGRLAVFDLE